MPSSFMLDTNAYFLLFQPNPNPVSYSSLIGKIRTGELLFFYISEITSMEIHSVLGKYGRGVSSQRQQCDRKIVVSDKTEKCLNTWITSARKPMNSKVFRDIQRLISDIEAKRGLTQASIIELDNSSIQRGRNLLISYAHLHDLGSHDALIAGTFMVARERGMNLTLITSDKGLKAVLQAESMPVYESFNGIKIRCGVWNLVENFTME